MINGHYLENYLIEQINPKAERYNTWWGENTYNSQFSPYERTTKKVKTINFFLYGSEYLLGNKKISVKQIGMRPFKEIFFCSLKGLYFILYKISLYYLI